MTGTRAIGSGFGRVFRQPRLIVAEIAWRWTLGAALLALGAFAAIELLDSIVVVGGDPVAGLLSQSARLAAILIAGAAFLSIAAAAGGRCATLPLLFRQLPAQPRFRALAGNAFLRAALMLAGALAMMTACLLAADAAGKARQYFAGWFLLAFVPAAALVVFCWLIAHWCLSIAPLFSVARKSDTLSAITGAVGLLRQRPAALLLIALAFCVFHVMLGGSAFVVAFGMLGSLAPWSRGAALAAAAAVALGYFALADCLRLVRMGAYAAVLEDESSQLDCSPDGIQAN